jgi:hypothetical protein
MSLNPRMMLPLMTSEFYIAINDKDVDEKPA